jgi:hypothetical protein
MKIYHYSIKGEKVWIDLLGDKPITFSEGGTTEEGYDLIDTMYWLKDGVAYKRMREDAIDCDGKINRNSLSIYNPVEETWEEIQRSQQDPQAEKAGY